MQDGLREAMLDAEQNVDSLGEQAFGRKRLTGTAIASKPKEIIEMSLPK